MRSRSSSLTSEAPRRNARWTTRSNASNSALPRRGSPSITSASGSPASSTGTQPWKIAHRSRRSHIRPCETTNAIWLHSVRLDVNSRTSSARQRASPSDSLHGSAQSTGGDRGPRRRGPAGEAAGARRGVAPAQQRAVAELPLRPAIEQLALQLELQDRDRLVHPRQLGTVLGLALDPEAVRRIAGVGVARQPPDR